MKNKISIPFELLKVCIAYIEEICSQWLHEASMADVHLYLSKGICANGSHIITPRWKSMHILLYQYKLATGQKPLCSGWFYSPLQFV